MHVEDLLAEDTSKTIMTALAQEKVLLTGA